MIKKYIKAFVNSCLAPFGAVVVPEMELARNKNRQGDPSAQDLRLRLFRQLSKKGLKPKHIIDVGAHKAGWSWDAYQIFPDCSFTLIEPQIEMKPYLDKFCSSSKKSRWILAGAGATEEELPFTIAKNSDGSSFTISDEKASTEGLERRILKVIPLDKIHEQFNLPIPEIVKIDAEGLDIDVVIGAQKLLGQTEIFFLELPLLGTWANQSFHTIIEFMKNHGYEPFDITDLNRRPSDNTLALMEMAFIKKDSALRLSDKW